MTDPSNSRPRVRVGGPHGRARSAVAELPPLARTAPASAPVPAVRSEGTSVDGLTQRNGTLAAVGGVSFSVGAGEVFSFPGTNGAGKSTTVAILEGLRRRSGGGVSVLGLDPWAELARLTVRIGVVPQDVHFFPTRTPREASRFHARRFDVRPDADELLARVKFSDEADDRYQTLSGGQQQKVGAALSLVNDPEICFLDEPTPGRDPRVRRSIWGVNRRLRTEGRTVFRTTRYRDEAQQLSDRIASIALGRIIADGAPGGIIARFGRPARRRVEGDPARAGRLGLHSGRESPSISRRGLPGAGPGPAGSRVLMLRLPPGPG